MKTKLKILHLEDIPADAELVERELKKGNIQFEKLVVDNKIAFEKALKEFVPDIIIADHTLPSFDSTEAIKIIKQRAIKIPFILVSATVSDEYAVEVMKAGADDYILKDRLHRLPQAVLNAMEKYRLKREKEVIIDELIRSQDHLKEAQAIAKIGSWEKDLRTMKSIWSEETYRIFETDPVHFTGDHNKFLQFIHPEDREKTSYLFENSVKNNTAHSFDFRIITPKGNIKFITENREMHVDDQGVPSRAVGTYQDVTERKIAELQLKDSEEKYRSFFDNSMDGILLTITDGKILAANSAACRMFQMTEEEICKVGRFGLVDPFDERVQRGVKERKKYGKAKVEITLVRKDGTKFPGEVASTVFKDSNGEERTSMIVRDLTEFKKSQKAILELQSNLQAIFENTSEGFTLFDTNGIIKTFNTKAAQNIFLNVGLEMKIGSNIYDFIHPSRKKIFKGFLSKVLAGEAVQYDYSYERKNGDTKWFNFTINPAYNKAGEMEGVCITSADITQRKKAEEERNMFFDLSIDMMGITGDDGYFNRVNSSFERILGYTPSEFYAKPFLEFVHPDDVPSTMQEVERLAKGAPAISFTNRYRCKDGNYKWLEWSAEPVGRTLYYIARDVTEKKRLEKAIENERDQFFEMFAKAPSAIGMLKGADHVFEMANPLYLQLLGKKNIIGKTVAEVFPEVIEQGFVGILDNVYRTGEAYIGTETLVKIDKEGNGELTDFYLNFIYQPYRNDKGNIEGVFFFINDITEQIQTRKAIEKSEKFFKGVIENSAEMIALIDSTGKVIYASPAVSKEMGYTYEECLEINIADIAHPEDALRLQEFLMKIMMYPGVPKECPSIRYRIKDGSYIWVEGTLTNFLEAEAINAIVANFRDVTERKKSENILKASEEFNRTILESSPDCLKVIDNEGRIQFMNSNGCTLMEVDDFNSLKNKYWWDLWGEENKQIIRASVKKSLEGKAARFEAFSPTLKGNAKWWDVMISPVAKTADGIEQIISVSRDITEKKKSEEANSFKANLLNTIGQAAIATDINGIVNYWNRAAENIYGWTKEEAVGKNIIDLTTSQASIEQAIQIMEELKKGQTWSGEFKVRKKDGTNFPALVTNSPIHDENNILSGIIGISSDITEIKKLEELLEKTNRLAAIGSWEIDVVKGTIYWSDITKEIREVDKDYVPVLDVGISYFKGIHKDTISQKVQECIENGTPWDEELQIITFKGNHKWVRTIGEGEFLNGKCLRIHGSFQDITERKIAEQKMIHLSERLQMATQAASVGIWDYDIVENILVWDDNMYKFYGITPDEFSGAYEAWEAGLHPDDLLSVREDIQMAIRGEKEFRPEFRVVRPDKSIHYIKANAWLYRDASGKVLRMIGTNFDITEQKELELQKEKMIEDIVQRNKNQEQFSYIVSHNLRAPVANILGLTNLLQEENISTETAMYANKALILSANKLDEVIKDLNDILHVRTHITERKELVNFSNIVSDIHVSIEAMIAKGNATIQCDFSEVTEMMTIKSYLYSIFYNLISNSIKYRQPNVPLSIEIKSQTINNKIILLFKDNGLGIDLEKQNDNVFGLYKRFHIHYAEGKGMGLYMVKTQVEAIGGLIRIKSEVNKGTEFRIEFLM
ncbi:MAG: PAS domain S-box protein [Bacteroidota bacterium]|nr:PAS domain S-box protein [Bacteroidota bacterium]